MPPRFLPAALVALALWTLPPVYAQADKHLDRPVDLAFDEDGNLFVVDFGNDRVQVWAPVGRQGLAAAPTTSGRR